MIKSVRLRSFRNFPEAEVSFSPKVNIFIGENGQGKSNLLEAIYVLFSGHSFRFAGNENLISFHKPEAILRAKASAGELDYDVHLTILKSKKNLLLNEKKISLSHLQKMFPMVVFSPESLSAIKEGADQRRTLVDDFLVTFKKSNADLIADFKKALRTRNRILKDFLEGISDREQTENLLDSLEPSYLRTAFQLTEQRILALNAISDDFNNAMQNISKSANVDISVQYVISSQNSINFSAIQIENLLKNRLRELRGAELSSGTTLVGPHKHDILFLYGENDSRFYCSQGQQRALILSFKMAQIVYHRRVHESYPVLLLDDVLSELDAEKRDSLIRFLSEINTQIFITTTDFTLPDSLKSEDCTVISVREGKIGSSVRAPM